MPTLSANLAIVRCPHCSVANPNLAMVHHFDTNNHEQKKPRKWHVYVCSSCGSAVTAWGINHGTEVIEYFPSSREVDADVPDRPRTFLQQAHESLHAPSGAVMLAASAVDSMLKIKGYTDGSLYTRIEKAVADNLITPSMATWAHEVRLDANDQRHADNNAPLPTEADAKRVIDFANALAEFVFVLPSRIQRGILPVG